MAERRHPTSVRLTDAECQLLDAWADYLGSPARPVSRSDVIVRLLMQAPRPTELGPTASEVRQAHRRAVMLDP